MPDNDKISFYKKVETFLKRNKTTQKARMFYDVGWKLILVFSLILVITLSVGTGIAAGYFASLVTNEPLLSQSDMQKKIYDYEESSELFFATNESIGNVRSDLVREQVKLSDMSDYVKKALVATEDENFYEHDGVVPKAIFRALFQEASNSSTRTGGSTLTQQLIKNQVLTNEVSFERKAKEITLALRLETLMSKDQILEAYLNVVSFGRNSSGKNIAGVQAAAKGLFGINVKDVNLAQAAYIAGLPQNPYTYTPFTNKGTLKQNTDSGIIRMKTVLERMHRANMITEQQQKDALAFDLKGSFTTKKDTNSEAYPWLYEDVVQRAQQTLVPILAKKDGYEDADLKKDKKLLENYQLQAERDLRQNGYKVYTTIHKNIYDAMQEAKNQFDAYGDNKIIGGKLYPVQAGASLIDNKTGAILGFVAGRDFSASNVNHATDTYRSNGSTMKPLLVYGPALESGLIQPGSIIEDKRTTFAGGYSPKNWDNADHGFITIREAVRMSYNVPAMKVYELNRKNKPIPYLEKMGINSLQTTDYDELRLGLGSLRKGVTVEQNVNAYATFANGGNYVPSYLIEKIVDKEGKVVYQHKSQPVPVFSPQTSYLMLDMMRGVIGEGTATAINDKLNFQTDWAGKTGTTQNDNDLWFVATNPNVTFGTWMGYDMPSTLGAYNGVGSHVRNLDFWATIMNAVHAVAPDLIAPTDTFQPPQGIVQQTITNSKGGSFTDIFNEKYLPGASPASDKQGQYLLVGGNKYAPLPTTPKEFLKTGSLLNFNVVGGENQGVLSTWSASIPGPTSVTGITLSGTTLTWSSNSQPETIGYYVYKDGKRIAAIPSDATLTTPVDKGTYYVTAVGIDGKESAPSNTVKTPSDPPTVPVVPPGTTTAPGH